MPRTLFACPECGGALTVSEQGAGREVRCKSCGAAVEVPFLPRAGDPIGHRRRGEPMPRTLKLAWGLVAVMTLLVTGGLINRAVRLRAISERGRRVAELVNSARRNEAAVKLDSALIEAEAALELIRAARSPDPGRVAEVQALRGRISVAEAKARLALLDQIDARRAVAEALTLRARVQQDQALVEIAVAVDAGLERSRLRQIDGDLALARSAMDDGRAAEALGILEEVFDVSQKLSPDARRTADKRLTAEAQKLVATHGLNLAPVEGTFLSGAGANYEAAFRPAFLETAQGRGYLTRPAKSPFAGLWDTVAPYRLSLEVSETRAGFYLQSKSQVSEIRGLLKLTRGPNAVWQSDMTGRTHVPVEGLPAYIASRLAVSDKRDVEAERRLYEDAFNAFGHQLSIKLRGLPVPVRPAP